MTTFLGITTESDAQLAQLASSLHSYTHTTWLITLTWLSQVLVVWKGSVHIMPVNQIGTWMELFVVSAPLQVEYDTDTNKRIAQWAALYQYFDEEAWTLTPYAYNFGKFSEEEQHWRVQCLSAVWSTLQQQWKFWEITTENSVESLWEIESIENLARALYWVALLYWSWKYSAQWWLEKIDIVIPNSAEFQRSWSVLLQGCLTLVWERWEQYLWLFARSEWSDDVYCTITITDWVILEYFASLVEHATWKELFIPTWDRVVYYLNEAMHEYGMIDFGSIIDWNECRLLKITSKSL